MREYISDCSSIIYQQSLINQYSLVSLSLGDNTGRVILTRCLCVSLGKKGSALGDYDPLTQADSEDESEEDDLVLNYPRNGLGRDSCLGGGSSKLRGGRSGRLVGATDEAQGDEEDEEEDEDEWRERLPSKSRQDRDDMKGAQYWNQRDSGRDRSGEDRRGSGSLGGTGLGAHSAEAEEKKLRMKNAVRSAFFLVPLVSAMLVVLLCAFLIPCRKGELEKRLQWERALGDAGGNKKSFICHCSHIQKSGATTHSSPSQDLLRSLLGETRLAHPSISPL